MCNRTKGEWWQFEAPGASLMHLLLSNRRFHGNRGRTVILRREGASPVVKRSIKGNLFFAEGGDYPPIFKQPSSLHAFCQKAGELIFIHQ